ncbi:hypothetical protein LCGC14_1631420, partial [marine sediment metagenome]
NWGTKHITAEDVYTEEKKYGREDEIHVTIKYGLHTANAKDVKNVLKNFGSFAITLGNISRFAPPDKEYDVVKLEVESPELHKLHSLLGEKLENSDEWLEYRPHVTFAYIKKGTCSQLSGDDTFKGEKIKVEEITFSSKDGNKETIQLRKKV